MAAGSRTSTRSRAIVQQRVRRAVGRRRESAGDVPRERLGRHDLVEHGRHVSDLRLVAAHGGSPARAHRPRRCARRDSARISSAICSASRRGTPAQPNPAQPTSGAADVHRPRRRCQRPTPPAAPLPATAPPRPNAASAPRAGPDRVRRHPAPPVDARRRRVGRDARRSARTASRCCSGDGGWPAESVRLPARRALARSGRGSAAHVDGRRQARCPVVARREGSLLPRTGTHQQRERRVASGAPRGGDGGDGRQLRRREDGGVLAGVAVPRGQLRRLDDERRRLGGGANALCAAYRRRQDA